MVDSHNTQLSERDIRHRIKRFIHHQDKAFPKDFFYKDNTEYGRFDRVDSINRIRHSSHGYHCQHRQINSSHEGFNSRNGIEDIENSCIRGNNDLKDRNIRSQPNRLRTKSIQNISKLSINNSGLAGDEPLPKYYMMKDNPDLGPGLGIAISDRFLAPREEFNTKGLAKTIKSNHQHDHDVHEITSSNPGILTSKAIITHKAYEQPRTMLTLHTQNYEPIFKHQEDITTIQPYTMIFSKESNHKSIILYPYKDNSNINFDRLENFHERQYNGHPLSHNNRSNRRYNIAYHGSIDYNSESIESVMSNRYSKHDDDIVKVSSNSKKSKGIIRPAGGGGNGMPPTGKMHKKPNMSIDIRNHFDQKENIDLNIALPRSKDLPKDITFGPQQSKSGFLPKLFTKANF